jgi:hypothetical protein
MGQMIFKTQPKVVGNHSKVQYILWMPTVIWSEFVHSCLPSFNSKFERNSETNAEDVDMALSETVI